MRGTANGVEVRKRSVQIVAHGKRLPVLQPDVNLIVGLSGRMHQRKGYAGHRGFKTFFKRLRRLYKAKLAVFIDLELHADAVIVQRVCSKPGTKHAVGTRAYDRTKLADNSMHVSSCARVCKHVDRRVLMPEHIDKRLRPKNMIRMIVGIDYRRQRFVTQLAKLQGNFSTRRNGLHRIDDNQSVIALNQNGICQSIANRHPYAVTDRLNPLAKFVA